MSGFQKSGDQPCFYCGHRAEGYDHMRARSRGGTSRSDNLVPACILCNSRKRALTLEEYRLYIQLVDCIYPVVFYGEVGRHSPSRDFLFIASRQRRGRLFMHNLAGL